MTAPEEAVAAAGLVRDIVGRAAEPAVELERAGLLDPALPLPVRVEIGVALAETAGLATAVELLGRDDLALAGAFCGAAQAALDAGMAYARQREVFGKPLARFPVQRMAFATATAWTEAALALARRAAAGGAELDVAAAVPAAADAAWRAVETALQVHGGYGYTDEFPVSRMWHEVARERAVTQGAGAAT